MAINNYTMDEWKILQMWERVGQFGGNRLREFPSEASSFSTEQEAGSMLRMREDHAKE